MSVPFLHADLLLPKSRLRVQGTNFARLGKEGGVIAEFSLRDIENVALHRPVDFTTLGIGVVALVFGAAGWIHAQAGLIRWGAAAVAVFVGGVCMIAQRKSQIRITAHGEDLLFDFADTPEDVNAFLYSLRERMREYGSESHSGGSLAGAASSETLPG